jgi:hypothetical protein
MSGKRYTPAPIIGKLREAEVGLAPEDPAALAGAIGD